MNEDDVRLAERLDSKLLDMMITKGAPLSGIRNLEYPFIIAIKYANEETITILITFASVVFQNY